MSDEKNARNVDQWREAWRRGVVEGMGKAAEIVRHTGADGFTPDDMIRTEIRRLFPDLAEDEIRLRNGNRPAR